MPPSLPIELIQQILEHVVNILFTENHATCDTFSAVGPPVDFLRGAAVVHSTWLPIVKDLYLRHAPITGGNYEAYLSLLQARGTEFISSIRFLRVVGMWWLDKATGEACWNVILAHSQEATEILSKLVGALPELREVELVRWIVNDLRWAAEHPRECEPPRGGQALTLITQTSRGSAFQVPASYPVETSEAPPHPASSRLSALNSSSSAATRWTCTIV